MNTKEQVTKSISSSVLALATLLGVIFLGEQTALLSVLLLFLSAAMLLVERTPTALIIYFTVFVLGPLSEALAIFFGAWSYSAPQVLGFPIWLPFVWGNAALFIIRLHAFAGYLLRSR